MIRGRISLNKEGGYVGPGNSPKAQSRECDLGNYVMRI
jgi:hypothetical protein